MGKMRHYLIAILFYVITIALYWIGGGEFERGFGLAFTLYLGLGFSTLGYIASVVADD